MVVETTAAAAELVDVRSVSPEGVMAVVETAAAMAAVVAMATMAKVEAAAPVVDQAVSPVGRTVTARMEAAGQEETETVEVEGAAWVMVAELDNKSGSLKRCIRRVDELETMIDGRHSIVSHESRLPKIQPPTGGWWWRVLPAR